MRPGNRLNNDMSPQKQATIECQVCHRQFTAENVLPGAMVRPSVRLLVEQEHPGWSPEEHICLQDLNRYRGLYVQHVLESERGDLSVLEQEVLESMRQHELLAANINEDFDSRITFGERVADGVARFGGSWTFIIAFGVMLAAWILINTHLVLQQPFDPFPFIFLNLVLSCLAAIQAPVIMMSQNRQGAKDRLQSAHDYQVNLKAELEIRHLHSKLDLMMTNQWHRLLEIQQVQTDLLKELADGNNEFSIQRERHPPDSH